MDPNRNARWSRLIAEELHRGGIRRAVLCPGSRNSPLLHALAEVFGNDACTSHVDERSAGFLALGMARAGVPAAVCVTSGSALANLLPAVVEAHAGGWPLVVVSADRPWELHGCGAPQAMPQAGILRPFLAGELPLGEPGDSAAELRALRARVARLAQVRGGPVHLNAPLRDPLPPLPDPAWAPPAIPDDVLHGRGDRPWTTLWTPGDPLPAWAAPGVRGVIAAGPAAARDPGAVQWLAAATGWPVLADAASGLRHPDTPGLVCLGDALVAQPPAQPDLIVVAGDMPLARSLYEWIDRHPGPVAVLEAGGDRDFLHRAAWAAPLATGAEALARACAGGDAAHAQAWLDAESAGQARLAATLAAEPWGANRVAAIACAAPAARLVTANSMAVRLVNLHAGPAERTIVANRGVNGIDGQLATALGAVIADPRPTVLLVGDLAFLHDLPALAARVAAPLAIVVVDNGGGGIFDFLAVAQAPGFRPWVRAGSPVDAAAAAAAFGCGYRAFAGDGIDLDPGAALAAALAQALASPGVTILHARVPEDGTAQHRRLLAAAAGRAAGAG
ncbi:MAG: hypothetical protein RLZZ127_1072 [Planctomycetota bacterium]|jgi:2-succinyl-5-enolpyruvyl-6-hydroxy-3-cyclohexene-1-carboxylate synthase